VWTAGLRDSAGLYNFSPTEVQPSGGALGGVTMGAGAGQSQEVTFTVSRTALPADDPVYFVPSLVGPPSSDATLLGRSAEGIEIHGSQQPFTTETVQLTVVTPPALPSGGYGLSLKLKPGGLTVRFDHRTRHHLRHGPLMGQTRLAHM